jgi:hypothetical protein
MFAAYLDVASCVELKLRMASHPLKFHQTAVLTHKL